MRIRWYLDVDAVEAEELGAAWTDGPAVGEGSVPMDRRLMRRCGKRAALPDGSLSLSLF